VSKRGKAELVGALVGGGCVFAVCGLAIFRELCPTPRPAVQGARLPPPPSYSWRSHPYTLLLAMRAGCPYCERSMGFYGELAALGQFPGGSVHLLAVFPDNRHEVEGVALRLHGIDILTDTHLSSLGVTGTPTILLVNDAGVVQDVWVGMLSSEGQGELMKCVRRHGGLAEQRSP